MPPKRAASTRAATAAASATITKATTKTTTVTAKKAAAPKKAAPKKAAAAKSAAVAKKPAAPKKAAVAKKTPAPKKAAAPRKKAPATESDKENDAAKVNGAKRKRDDEDDDQLTESLAGEAETSGARVSKRTRTGESSAEPTQEEEAPAAPKKRKAASAAKPAPKRVARELKIINEAPTQVMDIFVFGEGTAGELGLGSARYDGKKPIDVKRPRINHNLEGIVQVACGGMHVAALTNDNKILTWGVNDQGALGRDTTWDGGLRDVADEDESDDEDDTGMNPKESTPAEIDTSEIPENTKWVQVVASDSATFALTQTGQIYGWGTFRVCLLSIST